MKSILITGGTGTLGRALTKRILDKNLCERLCIFSRGEHSQAQMKEDFHDDGRLRFFVGDVRDYSRLKRALTGCDALIHAAALKRIEVGFYNPVEMARTNVDGSINAVEAATDANVKVAVLVSSDKAFQPVSAYGSSKAIAESIFLAANNMVPNDSTRFAVVRYGNVWCSAGSVIPKWKRILATGGRKVPVTSVDCTRFFMRVDEAVNLVINTLSNMKGGELAIPMLPAYRLGDLVEAMDAEPEITGLPEFEKLHESMSEGNSSDVARRMSVAELRSLLP